MDLNKLKENLKHYGIVEQCELKEKMIHVKITDFNNKGFRPFQCMSDICSFIGPDYPFTYKAEIDEGIFHIILKK